MHAAAVLLPRLLVALEVSDSEDTDALIVWDFHQRDLCDLNLSGLAAVMNTSGMFISSHLTYEERTSAVAVKI